MEFSQSCHVPFLVIIQDADVSIDYSGVRSIRSYRMLNDGYILGVSVYIDTAVAIPFHLSPPDCPLVPKHS